MKRFGSRRLRIGGVLLVAALLAIPVAAASAAGKSRAIPMVAPRAAVAGHAIPGAVPADGTTAYEYAVNIGPIKLAHGYKLNISDYCYKSEHITASAEVTKTRRSYVIAHYYYLKRGTSAYCNVAKGMKSGTMSVNWGRTLSVKVKLHATSGKKNFTEPYCNGVAGHFRKVRASGKIRFSIHPRVLGKVSASSARGTVTIYDGKCTAPTYPTSYYIAGSFLRGYAGFDASTEPHGKRTVFVYGTDKISSTVGGSFDDTFTGGKQLFTPSTSLTSGKVGSARPYLTGSLSYTADTQCNYGETSGKFTGKLVLHDPITGKLTLDGPTATYASESVSTGKCPS